MNDKVLGELLLAALVFICSARIFFTKKVKLDALAFFAPLSLFVSLLLFACWGLTIPEVIACALALLTFLFNLRALMRLTAGLVIDQYSIPFTVFCILMMLASLAAGAGFFLFRQVPLEDSGIIFLRHADAGRFGVEEQSHDIAAAGQDGFLPLPKLPVARVFVFQKQEQEEILPTLLFVPDVRSYAEDYRPLLIKLAARGYTIVTADFFTEHSRWFNSYKDKRLIRRAAFRYAFCADKDFAVHNAERLAEYTRAQYEALLALCDTVIPGQTAGFWLLSDEFSAGGMRLFKEAYNAAHPQAPDKEGGSAADGGTDGFAELDTTPVLIGTLDISTVEGCTPGFGSVEQTDPWTARLLGKERDHTLYTADHLARNIQLKLQATFHD